MEHRRSSDLRSGTFRGRGVQIWRRIRHQRPLNHPRRQRRRGSRAGEKHPKRTAISHEEPPTPKPYFAIGDEVRAPMTNLRFLASPVVLITGARPYSRRATRATSLLWWSTLQYHPDSP
ncbi:hypothetical protein Bca101_069894 [Brassica carinata]